MSARFIMAHDMARQRAIEAVRNAPSGYVVTITEPKRNLAQNAALHARLTEISQAVQWAGQRQTVETWKRLMTGAWCRATGQAVVMLPALDGAGVEIVFRRTSDLTERECGELLEFVNAWAAENIEQDEAA
jgi:hypothetical protein